MKILLIHNYYKRGGGEDTVVQNEKRLLEKNGHSVALYSDSNERINSLKARLKVFCSVTFSNHSRERLCKSIESFQPDIIHVHNLFPLITAAAYHAAIENSVPVVQTLHNYRIMCASALLLKNSKPCEICITKSAYNAVKYRCYQNSLPGSFAVANMIHMHKKRDLWNQNVDSFIALTDFAASKFVEAGVNESKITVKPNFVPPASIVASVDREPTALFVGRLSYEKGINILLDCWLADTKKELPRLKIIGDGPLLSMVLAKSKLQSNIEVLGKQKKDVVLKEMRKASCLVFPSIWYEGFPMVLLEALASGLPTICSDMGSMPSIIKHQETGLLFRPNDINDLTKKLERYFNDHKLMKKMRENCLKCYEHKYTPELNYLNLISIYRKTIKNYRTKNGH